MLRLVAFMLLGLGLASAQTVHVRWMADLKKKFSFQSFDRVHPKDPTWKSQQGIVFITPDEVAAYQVNERPGKLTNTNLFLEIELLDAHDGHLLKGLQLPMKDGPARVAPTHDGNFMVRADDVFYIYSAKFEQVAQKSLALTGKARTELWELEVSPSGKEIVLAHHLLPADEDGKEAGGKTDVQMLNADTLQTVRSFSVRRLDRWSAGDSFLVAADPKSEPGESQLGILAFDGSWGELKTRAENTDPGCPYHMEALDHQLIAAYDCDDLVIVTSSGTEKFSEPLNRGEWLVSVAGADHYLARASVAVDRGRPQVAVYDLRKKAQVLWVSMEKGTAYYSVSREGTLAVIDGDTLKFFEAGAPLKAKPF